MIVLLIVLGVLKLIGALVILLRRPSLVMGLFKSYFESLEKNQERLGRSVGEEISRNRQETGAATQRSREELQQSLSVFSQSVLSRMTEISTLQKNQLETFINQLAALTQVNEQKLEKIGSGVEERPKSF